MTNLPEQAHQRGTAVATVTEDDPYALDATMVTLPTLYIAQYQSKAFKRKLVEFGDLFVAIGAEDSEPTVVGKGGEPLSAPVRFYVHRLESGYDYAEDANNPKDKTLGRLGSTFQDALRFTQGDPRRVWQKFGYRITAPDYPVLPVRLFASGMSSKAARWMNTQIGILSQAKTPGESIQDRQARVLSTAFQIQTRPTTNNSGDFAVAVFTLADVKPKDAEADAALVEAHAALLANSQVQDAYDTGEVAPDTSNAPSLS